MKKISGELLYSVITFNLKNGCVQKVTEVWVRNCQTRHSDDAEQRNYLRR